MIAELHDGRKLEFPDGTDPSVVQATVKKVLGVSDEPASFVDKAVGSQQGRLLLGAASPVLSAVQMGANAGTALSGAMGGATTGPMSGPWVNEQLKKLDESKQRGMKALGNEGYDWMGLVGSLMPGAALGTASAKWLPQGAGLMAKSVNSAGQGALGALSTPTTSGGDSESYAKETVAKALLGGALSGAMPGLVKAGGAVAHVLDDAVGPLRQAWRDRAANDFFRKSLTDKGADAASAMVKSAAPVLPGSPMTVADAVAAGNMGRADKTGSLLVAAQDKLATIPEQGISDTAKGIAAKQQQVRRKAIEAFAKTPEELEAAIAERKAVTGPMREYALGKANIAGVKVHELEAALTDRRDAIVKALQDRGKYEAMKQASDQTQRGIPAWLSSTLQDMERPIRDVSPSEALRTQVEIAMQRVANPTVPKPDVLYSASESAMRKIATSDADAIPTRLRERTHELKSGIADLSDVLATRKAEADLIRGTLGNIEKAGFKPLLANKIESKIDAAISKPGLRASDVVRDSLQHVKQKLASLSNDRGVIDAEDLYMVRKEVGNTIKKYADEHKNFDQRLTAGLQKDIQGYIDDAIESAGGSGWKDYLSKYRSMSGEIDRMEIGQEFQKALTNATEQESPVPFLNAKRETARTITRGTGGTFSDTLADAVEGGSLKPQDVDAVEKVTQELLRNAERKALGSKVDTGELFTIADKERGNITWPNLLSRPAMFANWVMKTTGRGADERIALAMADLMHKNPAKFAETYLDAMPPRLREVYTDALLNRTGQIGYGAGVAAGRD